MRNTPSWIPTRAISGIAILLALLALLAPGARAQPRAIPDPLKPWVEWATWGEEHVHCPKTYSDAKKHFCFWPSSFNLQAETSGGRFEFVVVVFHETWVPLPGGTKVWPHETTDNGQPVPVVEHAGVPSVKIGSGQHRIAGVYRWSEVPQRIPVPQSIGILALTLDGQPVEAPVWDSEGFLWLKRDGAADEADKNFLSVKLYAVLEDGIPMWIRTELELTVSGKSREEDLGTFLPEGWKLASVESPIPVAIDETGKAKAQVRAGKWTISAAAFRYDNPKELRYAQGAKVADAEELLAFRSKPDFRIVEIGGAPSIDISQMTFPEKWRELPVYRWDTAGAIQIEERMRGLGEQKPEGLKISRELWLDENGRALTFRDQIAGNMQQIWRLDAAAGQELGSVRSSGQGQLITLNPETGAPGVEIRTRNPSLEATGRMTRSEKLPATGWRSDADNLNVTLNLPPGWRLLALFGADYVHGDWLTAWTLLDIFILLIFSLAVFRLWGIGAGLLALVAFGISYHEPGAPRYLWLMLLIPLALQRVVPEGRVARIMAVAKWATIIVFLMALVPFAARQVQQAIYPQLERVSERRFLSNNTVGLAPMAAREAAIANAPAEEAPEQARVRDSSSFGLLSSRARFSKADGNLNYDAKARIQTGPGIPEWRWRAISFGWNGPVSATQFVRPILIPLGVERFLTVLRVALLLALAALLLRSRRSGAFRFRSATPAAAVLLLLLFAAPSSAWAQAPDQATLDKLRERLLQPSDAFPNAAEIPTVALKIENRKLTIDAEIHVATRTAVPLPGRLPAWSPVSITVDEKPEAALRREDGYLWVALEPGVHRARVTGSLANVTEWEWTFLLRPRQVTIDAPDWTSSGVKADGVPEQQVFFTLKQAGAAGAAGYDRQDVQTVAAISRNLELGLVWQVRTSVERLSPLGKAVALRVPLLPGENVLSSNAVVNGGFMEVRLGAQEQSLEWESSMAPANTLQLATRPTDAWVERWRLVASPVWNVQTSGLAPTFDGSTKDLVPLWQPWPGEIVDLAISRPVAVAGATVTVNRASHEVTLGRRQRVSKLELSLRCSLGEDFLIELPGVAEITGLSHNGSGTPVRKDGDKVVIPLKPGEQTVVLNWKSNTTLGFHVEGEAVRLPVESANVQSILNVPDDRWVLWVSGPRRGPAVRFWGILACALIAAVALGRVKSSPVKTFSWLLLGIGLTQVPLPAALVVVGWLFFIAWRGAESFQRLGSTPYNFIQVGFVGTTAVAIGVLLTVVGEGLLGRPEMFIIGNGSSQTELRWFQARSDGLLPQPDCFSVSIWWYRLLMLAWALWLAASLIRWLRLAWESFSRGGFFHKVAPAPVPPPALPAKPTTPPPATPAA